MGAAFTPPPLSSYEGPAAASSTQGFTPPPLSSYQGPAASSDQPPAIKPKALGQISNMMGREDIPTLFQAPKDAAAAIGNPYGPGAQKAEIQPRNIESQGAADISSGIARTTRGTGNDVAGGISQAVRGAGSMAAPVAIPIGLATAPIQTIAGLAGGTLGAGVTHAALKHTNIPQGYKDLAEDAGGLVGGGLGAGVGSKVSPSITNAVMHPMETLTGINDNAPEVLLSKSIESLNLNAGD